MAVPHINAREYTLLIGGIEKGIPNACPSYECQRVHSLDRGNLKKESQNARVHPLDRGN